MKYNCKNCNLDIIENFCSTCGQKKYKRIDKKYVWDEIQYTTIHTNKGFLYSVKCILKNPGKTAKEFIEGNRVNHYKPISLSFLLSGISVFISFKVLGMNDVMKATYSEQQMNSNFMNDYWSFVSNYMAFVMLLFIPLFAIFSKLVFRKWGHNYYEHIVMNAFGVSFYTIIGILISPLYYILKENPSLISKISMCILLLIPIMMVWFYKNFYPEKPLGSIILRISLMLLIFIVGLFILAISAIIIFTIMNPELATKYFAPK
jgi:hypothetical protein